MKFWNCVVWRDRLWIQHWCNVLNVNGRQHIKTLHATLWMTSNPPEHLQTEVQWVWPPVAGWDGCANAPLVANSTDQSFLQIWKSECLQIPEDFLPKLCRNTQLTSVETNVANWQQAKAIVPCYTFHALFLIAWLADGDSLMCCIVRMGRQIARMFSTFSLWGSLFLMKVKKKMMMTTRTN